jgi:hypothetical protein
MSADTGWQRSSTALTLSGIPSAACPQVELKDYNTAVLQSELRQKVAWAAAGGQVVRITNARRNSRLFKQGSGWGNRAFGNAVRIGWGGAKGRPALSSA